MTGHKHWVKDPLYYRGLAMSVAFMMSLGVLAGVLTGGWYFIPLYALVGAGIATVPFVAKFGWKDNKL